MKSIGQWRSFLRRGVLVARGCARFASLSVALGVAWNVRGEGMPLERTYDVCVVGAGSSGICAATAAGRAGARTLLVERDAIAGGTTVMAGVNFPGTFQLWGRQCIAGCGWELVTNAVALAGGTLPPIEYSMNPTNQSSSQVNVSVPLYAALAEEMLVKAGVELRYRTVPVKFVREKDCWRVTLCASGELVEVRVRELVDATGNATVAAQCGAGREKLDKGRQPGSYMYEIKPHVDPFRIDWARVEAAKEEALAKGLLEPSDLCNWNGPLSVRDFLWGGGVNSTYVVDADNSTAEAATRTDVRGRAAMLRVYRFLRSQRALRKAEIAWAATQTGVRETYRVIGERTLTAEEYLAASVGEDAICHSCYPVDLHVYGGKLERGFPAAGEVPKVPFGALVPKGVDHLLVVGRAISSDRNANSALRVQATCMATGQAAGVAAALAAKTGVTPFRLDLREIKRVLREQGAIVP